MSLVSLHVLILIVTACFILYADHEVFAYIRGKKVVLSARKNAILHWGVWIGLGGMILTGLLLFYPFRNFYLQEASFVLKMCFVGVLVANGFIVGMISKVAATTPYRELPRSTKRLLYISGALSGIGWIGATTIGLFFL